MAVWFCPSPGSLLVAHVRSESFLLAIHVLCALLNTCAIDALLTWRHQRVQYNGTNWCDVDTGLQNIADGKGFPRSVYISLTRDGAVWVRAGADHKDRDWTYIREREHRFQDILISKSSLEMLKSFNYTESCALTDIDLVVKAEGGWHPSYLNVYNPHSKRTMTVRFRHNEDCYTETNVSLTFNKQGLVCDGGQTNTCGMNNLPDKGRASPVLFLRNIRFDPRGPEHHTCPGYTDRNYYSFIGSYYHIYIKVAQCPPLTDSRTLGYEAKLRPYRDPENATNTVMIADPSQQALNNAMVKGWMAFVKIVSLQHKIYLQVWRPSPYYKNTYTLVGHTFFAPRQLRFHEVAIKKENDMINVKRGDVLGLYFPNQNPIGWSRVPCANADQTYRFLSRPSNVVIGKTFTFKQAEMGDQTACRHYAFTAVFANKSDKKLVEDWKCPTKTMQPDPRKRSGSQELELHQNENFIHTKAPGTGKLERKYDGKSTIPVHIILIIIGCLLGLLIFVGFVSYYKAIHN